MVTRIKLVSGNMFYYSPKTSDSFQFAIIVNNSLEFIGGFLANEADRKLKAFSNLRGVIKEEVNQMIDLKLLKLQKFAEKLGAASKLFVDSFYTVVNDIEDADGTSSRAESCDERQHYYNIVGCRKLFKSSKSFMIGLLVANHVSIFGVKNFRYTFFKDHDDPQKEDYMEWKNRWADKGFKAPAAYVRALTLHK